MRLAVFLPNWVGDLVMATPALRALAEGIGRHGSLVGVLRPHLAEVLSGAPWLDELLYFDPRGADRRCRSLAVARELRRDSLDGVVLFTHSFRAAAIARASGAPLRAGYARNGRSWLLTHRCELPRQHGRWQPISALDTYLTLVESLGFRAASRQVELSLTPMEIAAADRAWRRLGIAPHEGVAAFNSSGAYGAAKLWPAESFAALARRTAARHGLRVVFLCGPAERDLARDIVRLAGDPRVQCLADEPPSLGLAKAAVARSRLMVTTDSGPRHFAAAFGVPVVTLFGPTDPAWSETRFDRAIHVQHPLDCGPCQQRECPLGHHRCMRDLTVEQVEPAIDAALQKRRAAA